MEKANSLSVSVWKTVQTNGQPKYIDDEPNEARQALEIIGAQTGLEKT